MRQVRLARRSRESCPPRRRCGHSEIKGRRHDISVYWDCARSREYKALGTKLVRDESDAREYERICKNGREAWILEPINREQIHTGGFAVVGG